MRILGLKFCRNSPPLTLSVLWQPASWTVVTTPSCQVSVSTRFHYLLEVKFSVHPLSLTLSNMPSPFSSSLVLLSLQCTQGPIVSCFLTQHLITYYVGILFFFQQHVLIAIKHPDKMCFTSVNELVPFFIWLNYLQITWKWSFQTNTLKQTKPPCGVALHMKYSEFHATLLPIFYNIPASWHRLYKILRLVLLSSFIKEVNIRNIPKHWI